MANVRNLISGRLARKTGLQRLKSVVFGRLLSEFCMIFAERLSGTSLACGGHAMVPACQFRDIICRLAEANVGFTYL